MKLFSIGSSKTSAEHFFDRLRKAGAKSLIDVRLSNLSQLAGFAKRDDLRYFSNSICGIPYLHELRLAPTPRMLDDYRRAQGGWDLYQAQFLRLMSERQVEQISKELFDGACLLCSEDEPHHCHRRLVAEYLQYHWGDVEIVHL